MVELGFEMKIERIITGKRLREFEPPNRVFESLIFSTLLEPLIKNRGQTSVLLFWVPLIEFRRLYHQKRLTDPYP